MSSHDPNEPEYWLDRPETHQLIFNAVVGVYLFFVVISFFGYEHHPHFDFEVLPFFQAFYGLFCCIGLVLAAKWMRTFLMRSEDYYDDE